MQSLDVDHVGIVFLEVDSTKDDLLREAGEDLRSGSQDSQRLEVALQEVCEFVGEVHRELVLKVVGNGTKMTVSLRLQLFLDLRVKACVQDRVRGADLDCESAS